MKRTYKIVTSGMRDAYADTFRDAIRIASNRTIPGTRKATIYTWNKQTQQYEVQ